MKGMLPLIIDNTAIDRDTAIARIKLLEEHGYDVLIIFCKADLDTRLARAASRERGVSPEVIKNTQQQSDVVVDQLYDYAHAQENDIPMYMYDSTNPNATEPIVRACTKFFNEPVRNQLGKLLQWDYFKRNQKERRIDPSKKVDAWHKPPNPQ